MKSKSSDPGFIEFVILMAMLTSMVAMSIDAMLPALSMIADDLGAKENEQQYVVSAFLISFGAAQMVFGPLSDSIGRKPAIYLGAFLYLLGSCLCLYSVDFSDMLLGRMLQGIGVAGPRVATLALVRDKYEGNAMARVMSLVMMVFIVVPMLAPIVGQGILLIADWRAIFYMLILLVLVAVIWLGLRQTETLLLAKRRPFSLFRIIAAVNEIFHTRMSIGYILLSGLIFSAFVGYLSSAQQIFQETYGLGETFPFYFAALASAIGTASYSNSRLVMTFGMRKLCRISLIVLCVVSLSFVGLVYVSDGVPPLPLFMGLMMVLFFGFGILFGNSAALAMEPLGHIAGVGASVVGSISALISVPIGAFIGQQFDGTVMPLVAGFTVFSILSLCLMQWIEKGKRV